MNSEQKLRDALTRLKEGRPIRVSIDRKISLSSVEDEAGVGRSLIRQYPELHAEALKAKKAQKQDFLGQKKTVDFDEIKKELDEVKQDLNEKKKEVSELRKAKNELIRTNAELFTLLNALVHKSRQAIELEDLVSSTTKVNISDTLRALLK